MPDNGRKATERIYLYPETKSELRKIGDRSQSDNKVVSNLINTHKAGLALAKALDEPLDPSNVSETVNKAGRTVAKLGAVLGYSSEQFWDFGLSRVQKAKVITFFEDDDPTRVRIRLAVGALQELVKEDHLPLEDILNQLVNRIKELSGTPPQPHPQPQTQPEQSDSTPLEQEKEKNMEEKK